MEEADSDVDETTNEPAIDVCGVPLEALIRGARDGLEGCLGELAGHPWTKARLRSIPSRAARDGRRNPSDIEEHLNFQLSTHIRELKNATPGGLCKFLTVTAKNYVINEGRRDESAAKYQDRCLGQSEHYRRHGASGEDDYKGRADGGDVEYVARGGRPVAFRAADTPEDHLSAKEQLAGVSARLRRLLNSLSDGALEAGKLFVEGRKFREGIIKGLMERTACSQSTAYRHLGDLERRFYAEFAKDLPAELTNEEMERRMRELIPALQALAADSLEWGSTVA